MDNFSAFAMGEANRGKEEMVFDWHKAARLIRESGCQRAAAGLRSDWEYTGGTILQDGKPLTQDDTYTYLVSTWAVPELQLDGGEKVPCYRMTSEVPAGETWDASTLWPESALRILRGEETGDVDSVQADAG